MKTIEIKGFWGFFFFAVTSLLILAVVITLPITFVWVSWNAFVGEIFLGPMISFWQATILTAIIAVSFQLIFQPRIAFEFKRVKSQDDHQ